MNDPQKSDPQKQQQLEVGSVPCLSKQVEQRMPNIRTLERVAVIQQSGQVSKFTVWKISGKQLTLKLSPGEPQVQTDLDRLKAAFEQEAWCHAACLSIAEGLPGWQTCLDGSPAVKAVKKLKQQALTAWRDAEVELPPVGIPVLTWIVIPNRMDDLVRMAIYGGVHGWMGDGWQYAHTVGDKVYWVPQPPTTVTGCHHTDIHESGECKVCGENLTPDIQT